MLHRMHGVDLLFFALAAALGAWMVFGCASNGRDLRGKWVLDMDKSEMIVPPEVVGSTSQGALRGSIPTIVLAQERFTLLPYQVQGTWKTDGKVLWLTPDRKSIFFEALQYEEPDGPGPRSMIFTISDSGRQINFAYRKRLDATRSPVLVYRKE